MMPSTRLTNLANVPVANNSIDAMNKVITAPIKKCLEIIGFKDLMGVYP
ncbi:hypothetical protein P20495_2161 [Pseudoalteromonas sp. BSi20495]|nr:hypothetical protein P20495_2161 [Pseudoalteromonas sp. BSi20495]